MSNIIKINQKIIYKTPVNDKIIIQVDKPALRRFSYIILVALGLVAYRAAMYEAFDLTNLTILLVGFVPFVVYALYYAYTRSNSTWYIDLKAEKIILGTIGVPYYMIDALQVTKKEKSELSIETKDKKKLVLFTDQKADLIMETGQFFSSITKLPLRIR